MPRSTGSPRRRSRGSPLTRNSVAIAAGLAVGCLVTWNVSNVGAVADPLAVAYGVSLAAVGLLTTALFVAVLASQLPAGRWCDRYGARNVALAACAAAALGNALLLLDDSYAVGLAGRFVAGIGTGAGFVAGLDLVRAGGGGPVLHGIYGGATLLGGGLALAVLPALTQATSWRAPYWTALALALLAAAPTLAATGLRTIGRSSRGVLGDRRLLPLGALQAATFGLRDRRQLGRAASRAGRRRMTAGVVGGLVLLSGIVARPLVARSRVARPPRARSLSAHASLPLPPERSR